MRAIGQNDHEPAIGLFKLDNVYILVVPHMICFIHSVGCLTMSW